MKPVHRWFGRTANVLRAIVDTSTFKKPASGKAVDVAGASPDLRAKNADT
jgi:hypothetical protein